jgi:hypothetical protein
VGSTIDVESEGFARALQRTGELLGSRKPIFEAGVSAEGAIAFADVMLPVEKRGRPEWRIIEVKSSGSVKDYHRDDAAVQAFVARAAGVPLASIAIAHIDTQWVYQGNERYQGLLLEEDVTEEVFERGAEVKEWVGEAHALAARNTEPKKATGAHCTSPYECGFLSYCKSKEAQPEFPIDLLPRISKKIRSYVEENKLTELKQVPNKLLNETQLRVKKHTLNGKVYFDAKGAAKALAQHALPALFLDFETISFAVPIWTKTRPYQQIPFQFSVHTLSENGPLEHAEFLDLSGGDPSLGFTKALVQACKEPGPVFVYNATFEKARLAELAARFPTRRRALVEIADRIVDLLPIAQRYYYHPGQSGSWSIKALLPALVPELGYQTLDGVRDGGMAMDAFLEATYPHTPADRKSKLESQLRAYCRLDTYAMVRIWQFFASRPDLSLSSEHNSPKDFPGIAVPYRGSAL